MNTEELRKIKLCLEDIYTDNFDLTQERLINYIYKYNLNNDIDNDIEAIEYFVNRIKQADKIIEEEYNKIIDEHCELENDEEEYFNKHTELTENMYMMQMYKDSIDYIIDVAYDILH